MKSKEEQYEVVISALSWFIWHYSCIAAAEQYAPTHSADEMDHLIAEAGSRATEIRLIRDRFEAVVSGFSE